MWKVEQYTLSLIILTISDTDLLRHLPGEGLFVIHLPWHNTTRVTDDTVFVSCLIHFQLIQTVIQNCFRGSTAVQNSPSLETDGIFFSTTNSTKYLLPPNTEELILGVSGRTKCVHNRLVHIELVGAQASQAARQAVRHAWTNLGSLGSIDHLSSLGNRGRP